MMSSRLRIFVLSVAVCLSPAPLIAQLTGGLPSNPSAYDLNRLEENHLVLVGQVTSLAGDPVRGAKVEVETLSSSGGFQTYVTNLQGGFQSEYWLNSEMIRQSIVTVTVTKKGFLKARETIELGDPSKTFKVWKVLVTLREPEEDPKLLSQADLVSKLTPRLRKPGASEGLSAAGEKDYARGVEEFLDRNRPDRALPHFTKVTHEDASCVQCRTMLALAQLESGDWDGSRRTLAQAINKILANPSVGRPEAPLVYGVMESWRHEPTQAIGYLGEALKLAPQDPLALQEMGRAQLLNQNWGTADLYLSKAIAANAGPEARRLRVEALLGGDHSREANAEMIRYLNGRDVKKEPLPIRELWGEVQDRVKVESTYVKASTRGDHAIDYLHRVPPDLKGLDPAADQGQLDSILDAVGKTVAAFFRNFPNTTSVEQIHQEKLTRNHKSLATLNQKFHYLCFTPAKAFGPGFSEYRADSSGTLATPRGLQDGFMLTSGFASASLLFHPKYQSQTEFRYLGRQKVNGRDTYVIAFAQQPAKARLNGSFSFGEVTMPTFSQGLAWVDSESYEITRLRTDLLMPLAEVKLQRETTEIHFAPVHFKGIQAGFLVPQEVTVSVDWNKKHLRNEHRYSDFRLFKVDALDKVGTPKEVGETSIAAPDSQTPP